MMSEPKTHIGYNQTAEWYFRASVLLLCLLYLWETDPAGWDAIAPGILILIAVALYGAIEGGRS